jgi:hypothetical protein
MIMNQGVSSINQGVSSMKTELWKNMKVLHDLKFRCILSMGAISTAWQCVQLLGNVFAWMPSQLILGLPLFSLSLSLSY